MIDHIENQNLKDHLGLQDNFGVLITRADIEDVEFKENDVLISINGKKISNDGKIDSKYGKISFGYELDNKQIGETVKFEIIRNKKKIDVVKMEMAYKKIIKKQ